MWIPRLFVVGVASTKLRQLRVEAPIMALNLRFMRKSQNITGWLLI